MTRPVLKARVLAAVVVALGIGGPALANLSDDATAEEKSAYRSATAGTRSFATPGGFSLKMLVEAANLGGSEVELGELTLPANYKGSGHLHGSIEIFYILSGELTHVVNGQGAVLAPGMVGIVRPGDSVEHIVASDKPVKMLVIWVPGGEAERILGSRETEPIKPVDTARKK